MAELTLAEAEVVYARLMGINVKVARTAIFQGIERGEIQWDPSVRILGTNQKLKMEGCLPAADSPIYVESFERFLDVRRRLLAGESSSTEAAPAEGLVSRGKLLDIAAPAEGLVSRGKLLDMVLGMAMDAYKYNPDAERNLATGEKLGSIKVALERVGITIDADTVRKALTEAKTNRRK